MKFYKLCGSGNDFIVVDNREKHMKRVSKQAQELCDRHFGIGADGLILLETSKKADLKMRIINADGTEAEMCGNGMRCAAWAAHHILGLKAELSFETLAGMITTSTKQRVVKVQLCDPVDFRDLAPLEVNDGIFYFYFLNTGVPHCIIFEDDVSEFPVDMIGREVRHHPHFQPNGTNVNFVQIKDAHTIYVRTYERGVEAETLACGTGATASAIASALINKCESPVNVITSGGETLKIYFEKTTYDVTNVFLEGSVAYIFEGNLSRK